MQRRVIDVKFVTRNIVGGDQYGNPHGPTATGNTVEEYLRQQFRGGWDLYSLDMLGRGTEQGVPVISVFITLVRYEGTVDYSGVEENGEEKSKVPELKDQEKNA